MRYLWLLILTGCASQMTAADREWHRAVDLENWTLCEQVYKANNEYTTHFDHQHGPRDVVKPWHIKDDL